MSSSDPTCEVISGAQVTRVILEGDPGLTRRGVEYRAANGETAVAVATKEVVLSAGAVGSPQILLLSGIGPRNELEAVGVACRLDSPHVGKHLKDHLQIVLLFPAPGVGVSMTEVGTSMGPDALRAPAGPLPADPADDADLPRRAPGPQRGSRATVRRVGDHRTWPRLVFAVRGLRLVLHRAWRSPHA